ncbi:hypothetical protein BJ165DRAFT_1613159 [Panaeolus papilionaceus]|nr:hypothetical protein BJ165DRAFT_1613159 [Panaeolus papilionaceus]
MKLSTTLFVIFGMTIAALEANALTFTFDDSLFSRRPETKVNAPQQNKAVAKSNSGTTEIPVDFIGDNGPMVVIPLPKKGSASNHQAQVSTPRANGAPVPAPAQPQLEHKVTVPRTRRSMRDALTARRRRR